MAKPPPRRTVLVSFRFLGTALIGSLVMALVTTFAPLPAQLAVLGAFVSILGGLFVSYLEQEEARDHRRTEAIQRLAVPLALAPEDDLYPLYLSYCRTLTALAEQTDPLLREIAALKLASVNAQIESLAAGTVVFAGTETWRAVYEQLLAGGTVREYRSVAWVRSRAYWQDAPGRQSMRANFEAVHRRVLIERITEPELVDLLCERFARAGCDGLYLTAVNNLGVHFPVERVVRRLEAAHTVRVVVVDAAQEFCHAPHPLRSVPCDLYLAGAHKWLRGYHPLGMAFYGRRQSRDRVRTVLAQGVRSGEIDDPLLRFTARLESGTDEHLSETVNLAPLFSTTGALADANDTAGAWRNRMRNRESAAATLHSVGWEPLLPDREFRSGILLVRAERTKTQTASSDSLRAALREAGIAATTYPGGLVRLSMPPDPWRSAELDHLRRAFKSLA